MLILHGLSNSDFGLFWLTNLVNKVRLAARVRSFVIARFYFDFFLSANIFEKFTYEGGRDAKCICVCMYTIRTKIILKICDIEKIFICSKY